MDVIVPSTRYRCKRVNMHKLLSSLEISTRVAERTGVVVTRMLSIDEILWMKKKNMYIYIIWWGDCERHSTWIGSIQPSWSGEVTTEEKTFFLSFVWQKIWELIFPCFSHIPIKVKNNNAPIGMYNLPTYHACVSRHIPLAFVARGITQRKL